MKKLSKFTALSMIILGMVFSPMTTAYSAKALQPYAEVYFGESSDLSGMSLSSELDLLNTLSFGTRTKWPAALPKQFKPEAILEYGKDPGLSIRKLHQLGYTGKKVNIAYIDQPLIKNHVEYDNVNLNYSTVRLDNPYEGSMHGPSVLSLLSGKNIGVAPDANVYYVGHPAWLLDQTTHAEAIRKIIKTNASLPAEQKIKLIGLSDMADPNEKNVEEMKKAMKEAEAQGIKILDVTTFNLVPLTIDPMMDKNDPSSYKVAKWYEEHEKSSQLSNLFYVPSSGRTTASGGSQDSKETVYWTNGGLSWTVPYIEGVIALGLQIDPTLEMDKAYQYLLESGTPYRKGKMINPEEFVAMVEANKPLDTGGNRDYYYFLYSGNQVSAQDLDAIRNYARKFTGYNIVIRDTHGVNSAAELYGQLQQDSKSRKGTLKGIQIFGSATEVPAFRIQFKILMMNNQVDDAGSFASDFFYSTFNNDKSVISKDFSIYRAFNETLKVDFTPDWKVVRLPLAKGEIAPFLQKYHRFVEENAETEKLRVVNFSNPIFAAKEHADDMSYFIKYRLDQEFGLLKSSEYTLYGNHEGFYPVSTPSGDFTQSNLSKENDKGVANLFINSHGQANNIDQAIFGNKDATSEKRISFINSSNINQLLSRNYYALTTWTCNNVNDLTTDNLVHTALAKGKAVNAFAASTIISNNGVNNRGSLDQLKNNNFYYFHYEFFKAMAQGATRSDGFFRAQQAYSEQILKHTGQLGEGNYQFNLLNVLSYHNLGVIEYREKKLTDAKAVSTNTNASKPGSGTLKFDQEFKDKDLKIHQLTYRTTGKEVQFTVNYESGSDRMISLFNPPNGDLIRIVKADGLKKGKHTVTLSVPLTQLQNSNVSMITMGFGDGNFIFFNKTLLGL